MRARQLPLRFDLRASAQARPLLGVQLVDEAEADECQVGVHRLDLRDQRCEQLREPPGGDDPRFRADLRAHPCHDPLDQPHVAVDEPGLHRCGGAAADDRWRGGELDAMELGGAADQRLEADQDARGHGAAEVLPGRRHRVEGGGGAEVEEDGGGAVEVATGQRVGRDALIVYSLIAASERRRYGLPEENEFLEFEPRR